KTMSRGEYLVLPKDTVMFKKQYFHNRDPDKTVFTSVVLSGRNRDSIHRPEVCMVGQGNVIEKSEVIEVPLPGREPLKVMVLHLSRKFTESYTRHSYYAYWFVGKDRETPHHLERLMWMSIDRLLRNVTHRWAYIAVSGDRAADLEDKGHYDEIREVVGKLYPEITLVGKP
ncbi:MAG: exosortase-associated EpsI family protein, partial [Kiritimatiellia bacterium]